MIMMLPFVTAAVGTWQALQGKRRSCLGWWLATFVIFVAWSHYHMTGTLPISL